MTSLQDAGKWLHAHGHYIIFSHVRPDGDAIGSSLALGLSLKAAGKEVMVCNQDPLPAMYDFLPGKEILCRTPVSNPWPDAKIIALDTSTEPRLGETFTSWGSKVDLSIDHHVSNTLYARDNLIQSDVPSTASIILDLLEAAELPLSSGIADNLFVGISTDTGSFRYRGTTAATFRQAARLSELGADTADLSKRCYQSMTPERFDLNRLALGGLKFECGRRLAYITLTPAMFAESGAKSEDTEGLVEQAQLVESVELAALFEFRGNDALKISLRSKGAINVNEIASSFGGGGHKAAAGINFSSGAEAAKESVLQKLRNCFPNS